VSSRYGRLREVLPVGPGGFLVVEGAGLQASVQDADEPVRQPAQRVVVLDAAGAELVVKGAGAGRCPQGRECLRVEPIDRLDEEVRQRAKADPQVKVLTQLPGVGPFTALVLLAEIGDITRSGSARKLASWAGLTPTVRGSDRTVHHGHISKQGPTWVRWVACEAAQTAKRHPDFAPGYEALARRRGNKIATTAVFRKLITRAYHLLTDAAAGEPR